MIALTQAGKLQVEEQNLKGPKQAVLSLIYERNAPVEVEEVMDATRMEDEKALTIIKSLINAGYIKEL